MICRLYRWFIDCRVDDNEPLGPMLERHIESCPGCADHYDQQLRLSELLIGSRVSSARANAQAYQTIVSSLPGSSAPGRAGYRRYALAAVIFFGLGISMLLWTLHSPQPEHNIEYVSVAQMEDAFRRSLSFEAGMSNYDLETEIKNLSADTQAAADFLLYCAGISP